MAEKQRNTRAFPDQARRLVDLKKLGYMTCPYAKMLSSLNAFEISNIQKQETEYLNHAIGM